MDDLEQLEALAEDDGPLPPRRSLIGLAVPALALVCAGGLLWEQRADVAYLLSSTTPLELGAPGDYHLDRAEAGRLARVTGLPGAQANPYHRGFYDRELLPLQGVPIIVDRRVFRGGLQASMTGGIATTNKLLTVEGRLEPETHAPELAKVIRVFLEADLLAAPGQSAGTSHVWILTQDLRPWHASWLAAWLALLAALVVFNATWLLRRLAT